METLDRYFSNVCELDLMFNLEMVRLVCTVENEKESRSLLEALTFSRLCELDVIIHLEMVRTLCPSGALRALP